MAIKSGNPINDKEIINGFITNVYNTIVSGCYDNTNIPEEQEQPGSPKYKVIDINYLGNLAASRSIIENYLNNIGPSGSVVNAAVLAQFMSLALQVLRKVGTWSYIRTYNNNGEILMQKSLSGKAIFSDAYVSSLGINIKDVGTVAGNGLAAGQIISASSITTYYTTLLNRWNAMVKPTSFLTVNECHTNCHNDCHSDCHSDCNCYK